MAEKQYREKDVDDAIIGKAIMWEDADDTLEPVSAEKPLPTDMSDDLTRLLGKITNYDVLGNGTLGALNETVEIAGAGLSTLGFQISGTWEGTIVAELEFGDSLWDVIPIIDQTLGSAALSTTANGHFLVGIASALTVRIRMSLYTSGTAVVYMEGTSATAGVFLSRSLPTGLNSIGTVGLDAGSELIGKVGIDQTTPGTTNKVVASVAAGGIAAGAKVAAAEIDGHSQTLGITTGAAVVTDASGTIQQYLRGLVKLIAAKITVIIDQTTPGTTNRVDAGDETDISQSPTVTAGAYAADDAVGGLLTFANAARAAGMGGVFKDLLIIDDSGNDVEMELWLFKDTFTNMADNAPWAPSEADLRKLVGIISTADGAWFAAGTPSVGRVEASQEYTCVGTSLYGQLVAREIVTFTATDDVTAILGLLRH